jgi:ribosomal protein S18 acetylase RimI-like enzyme
MQLIYQEYAPPEEEGILSENIFQEAVKARGMSRNQPFSFMIKDEMGNLQGGITGTTYYGYLYIELLWVAPKLRKLKWGTKLMEAAEKLAKELSCTYLCVTTMDWEAMPFYKKLGYQLDYTHDGFENNSLMYVLRKKV